MISFWKLMADWSENGGDQRLGQYFVNLYLKDRTFGPNDGGHDLFTSDLPRAMNIIRQWLLDHQYIDELPRQLEERVPT